MAHQTTPTIQKDGQPIKPQLDEKKVIDDHGLSTSLCVGRWGETLNVVSFTTNDPQHMWGHAIRVTRIFCATSREKINTVYGFRRYNEN